MSTVITGILTVLLAAALLRFTDDIQFPDNLSLALEFVTLGVLLSILDKLHNAKTED